MAAKEKYFIFIFLLHNTLYCVIIYLKLLYIQRGAFKMTEVKVINGNLSQEEINAYLKFATEKLGFPST